MGGGGEFVRAAAKMAGAGVANAVVRGSPTVPQFGQFLRGSPKPASVFVGPSSPVPPATYTSGAEVEAVMKSTAEIGDWEFADGDLAMEAAGFKTRIVFGSAPSFAEAKEATMEVKEALDRIYLSSSLESRGSNLMISSYSKLEPESCLAIQTSPWTSVPPHAIQAFKLLKESAEAQTVVASIVSDANVWNAMLNNEELKSFLQSETKLGEAPDVSLAEESKTESRNVVRKTIKYIRTSIDGMLAKASGFFKKVFESSPAEVSGNDKATTSGYSSVEIAMEAAIMGLATIVIAVMVAKRN